MYSILDIFKSVDHLLHAIGFNRVKSNKSIVRYERYDNEHKFMQVVEISQKRNGTWVIQSYDYTNTTSTFSPAVALTDYELYLFYKKVCQMKHRKSIIK